MPRTIPLVGRGRARRTTATVKVTLRPPTRYPADAIMRDGINDRIPRNPEARRLNSPQEGRIMPKVIELPARSGTLDYDDDTVAEVAALLAENAVGTGITVEDEPQDTEPKARSRAKVMRTKLAEHEPAEDAEYEFTYGLDDIKTHAVKGSGDNEFYPAVSIKKLAA